MPNLDNDKVSTFTDNGRLYLKAFLLDSSVNINEWGVTPASLKRNINTFIGKPLVLTEDYSHPVPAQADSLNHWLSYQEDYRIGTIVDVVPKDSAYYALIEITDPDAKKAIEGGAIPNYVSPAIAQTLDGSPAEAMKEWTGVHLAIVDEPAFTVKKATITASCGGDSAQCLLQLRKAKIERTGIRGCGFCNFKALTALAKTHTSHTSLANNFHLVKLEDNNTVNKNTEPSTSKMAETNPPPPPETVPKTQYDELVKKLADAELKAKELSETNKSISGQVAEIQLERRREKIERIITAELIKDDNKRIEKINTMVASSIPVKEIEDLYKDAFIVRKASVESKTAKAHVTIGSNDKDEEITDTGPQVGNGSGGPLNGDYSRSKTRRPTILPDRGKQERGRLGTGRCPLPGF